MINFSTTAYMNNNYKRLMYGLVEKFYIGYEWVKL